MKRNFALAMLLMSAFALFSCSSTESNPTASPLADGWLVRADSGTGAENQFSTDGDSYHFVISGSPDSTGTFYNEAWTATGNHTFSAILTQNKKASHPTSYGLMFGGANLAAAEQRYSYFLVRQTGEFYIARRTGPDVATVVPWTASTAILGEVADGTQRNTLAVQVAGSEVIFSVNGTEVRRLSTSEVDSDGLFGFRIGHGLDVTASNVVK